MSEKDVLRLIEQEQLNEISYLKSFVMAKQAEYSVAELSRIIELANTKRETYSAYYTNDFIIKKIMEGLPEFHNKTEISIIEPSVGVGNFLPFLFEKYSHIPKVNLLLMDIDEEILSLLQILYQNNIPKNFHIQLIHQDFLLQYGKRVDLIIGNPPFTKLTQKQLESYATERLNTQNLAGLFLDKAMRQAEYVSLIMPKNLLNTPEYDVLRHKIKQFHVQEIIDFGELGFKGVLIETINISIKTESYIDRKNTKIISLPKKLEFYQQSEYIFDSQLPYWIIYRNQFFDQVFSQLKFDVFDVFRDRQITNSNTRREQSNGSIRVIKSRNIDDTGENILDIQGYDIFIQPDALERLAVGRYLHRDDVYLTPNMTYNPRMIKKLKNTVVNGSVAILIPKFDFSLTKQQMRYFASDEFRQFYRIARNHQTRSLNIDKNSVYWFGIQQN